MSAINSQPGDASEDATSQTGFSGKALHSHLLQEVLNLSSDATFLVDEKHQIRFWNRAADDQFDVVAGELAGDLAVNESVINKLAGADRLPVERTVDTFQVGEKAWKRIVLKCAQALEDLPTAELYRLAQTDHLSKLLNRRGFQKALECNLHHELTLAIVDIDNFKAINDGHGHEAGDHAIRFVADALQSHFNDAICIGRLGGDEFGVVTNTTDQESTKKSFNSVCDFVQSSSNSAVALRVTISIGVAVSNRSNALPRDLLTTADKAMYQSKNDGRNQVTIVSI